MIADFKIFECKQNFLNLCRIFYAIKYIQLQK